MVITPTTHPTLKHEGGVPQKFRKKECSNLLLSQKKFQTLKDDPEFYKELVKQGNETQKPRLNL